MRLAAAARAFDRAPCYEAYTGLLAFHGQLGLFDDNKRDSETAGRRILTVAASVAIPNRRVVTTAGVPFIIGHRNIDLFNKSVVRVSYVINEAPELARIRTLGETCLDASGFSAYAGRAWLKNLAYTEQDSKLPPQYHIHFANNEPVRENLTVDFADRLYIVRSVNMGMGGTLIATCDQLEEPAIELGLVTTGDFNPVTESLSGNPLSVRVLRIRWQSLFNYQSEMAPRMGSGDIQVAIAFPAVKPGAKLVLSDGTWYIASVEQRDGAYVCRATRHVSN